jgi:hypothetical protein
MSGDHSRHPMGRMTRGVSRPIVTGVSHERGLPGRSPFDAITGRLQWRILVSCLIPIANRARKNASPAKYATRPITVHGSGAADVTGASSPGSSLAWRLAPSSRPAVTSSMRKFRERRIDLSNRRSRQQWSGPFRNRDMNGRYDAGKNRHQQHHHEGVVQAA